MMMKVLSTLLVTLFAVTTASAAYPERIISRWTGYPSWRIPTEGWDSEKGETVTIFSLVGILIGISLVLRYELLVKDKRVFKTIDDTYHNNSRIFSTIISYYLFVTFFAVFGFWVLDLGKLWSTVGALHNLLEVAILLVMSFERRPDGFRYFYGFLFTYLVITEFTCLILNWPWDAIFFKFQGLATDIALVINFFRLYLTNRDKPVSEEEARHASHVEELYVDEEESLLNNNSNSFESPRTPRNILNRVLPGRHSHHTQSEPAPNVTSSPSTNNVASHIMLLVIAAGLHTFSNIIVSLSNQLLPFLLFQFSYGISYPLYGYYVAREPENTRIRWFDVSFFTESIVAIVSITLSALVVGTGALMSLHDNDKL
jgi:hypothetical protein